MRSCGTKSGTGSASLHAKGFTLIASLLMLLLLSGIAIGLMMMVNTEGKVGGTDLQNNQAYHAAEGGIEKMYADLSAVFQNSQAPNASDVCNVGTTPYQPVMAGVIWKDYSVTPQGLTCPVSETTTMTSKWGTINSGQNDGLYAEIIPVNMLATAALLGGQEVSMTRQAQVALIPVFQFGMFCENDCSIFPGANMTFAGPVHSNADFYPFVNTGATLTFQAKVSAYGNIIRTVLPNTFPSDKNGTVLMPTASNTNACSTPTTNCTTLSGVSSSTPWGDGSVVGLGGNPPQSTYSSAWTNWSNNTTHDQVINGNYGSKVNVGTGAKKLSMPFVNGSNFPYEIIRQPPAGESPTSLLGESREYNMAQIHILLDDDPANLPGGAGDTNNVRLANVTQPSGNTTVTPWGVTMAAGNWVPGTFGTPSGTNTYDLYFAAASNAVPIPASCSSTTGTCPSDDWSLVPQPWTNAMATADGVTYAPLQPSGPGTPPYPGAPVNWQFGPAPTVYLCPPNVTFSASPTPALPPAADCPSTPAYPYYALPNPSTPVVGSALTAYNSANSDSWNLIDGWLRVEYLNNSGAWVAVTNEWLSLGFARGVTAPTANSAGLPAGGTSNPINPNAILLFQEPADRGTTNALATLCTATSCPAGSLTALSTGITATPTATAPVCKTTVSGKCTVWTPGVPPQLPADTLALAQSGSAATTGKAGDWAFGVTPAAPTSTTPQSLTMYNWYPINFYDAREGEPRDIDWSGTIASDNSCTANGVMNAVELDVGNLQQWLLNSTNGKLVNYTNQNGYIIYFSDRRGMLPNPNVTSSHPINTKSGDSGLEDTINTASAAGTPNGLLEPKMTEGTWSPEDDNENGVLDNWGAYNLGLGFYGLVGDAATPGTNLNTQINTTGPSKPDPYGTIAAGGNDRIKSCGRTARKNWVSGARHVLKLVDGAIGNVPLMPVPVVYNSVSYFGGFTVASENPVYIQGNYNSAPPPTDTTWTTGADVAGEAAAAVIADAVTLLSNNWDDRVSMVGGATNTSPTTLSNRPTTSTYYRVAIAAGKNMTFTYPAAWAPADDVGTDGGVHNFLRLLEDWGTGGVTENYKGSLASLYYSTYATGVYKCCTAVYGVPNRNFFFDLDFTSPAGLPPGTPMFRDVESLSYRELYTTRSF
jgi:Tfp pilus assembly protein PilX